MRSEKSGIEFYFRLIGGRCYADDVDDRTKKPKGNEDEEEDEEEDDEDMEEGDAADGMPVEALSAQQLQGAFGREALNMMGATFPHTSHIGDAAEFQKAEQSVQTKQPNGKLMI